MTDPRSDLDRLYGLFRDLEQQVDGTITLSNATGYMDWPDRGVYFSFADEKRGEEVDTRTTYHRLTRVGTHAIARQSKTTLWNRIRTHRGVKSGDYPGGGNHRGSVFRERVGKAMIERDGLHDEYPHWGDGLTADSERRYAELELERRVSDYIRDLHFLYVKVDDEAGPDSDRVYIERNTIALVSNYGRENALDPRSDDWLGNDSPRDKIASSGLWNIDHVDENYDAAFLDRLSEAINETTPL